MVSAPASQATLEENVVKETIKMQYNLVFFLLKSRNHQICFWVSFYCLCIFEIASVLSLKAAEKSTITNKKLFLK